MIKQEVDLSCFFEICDKPHDEERSTIEEINYRKFSRWGKNSGIFDLCADCRPAEKDLISISQICSF